MKENFVLEVARVHLELTLLRIPMFDSVIGDRDALRTLFLAPKLDIKWGSFFKIDFERHSQVNNSGVSNVFWSVKKKSFVFWNIAFIDKSFTKPKSIRFPVFCRFVLDASECPIVCVPDGSKPPFQL